ncbi:hypothetical protein CYMTET_50187 [Cymbomonas tetramitiformis]|uniref:Cyclic nucleotide-binding domain-containing protein n=1 Tax=Cymbomonas tetramitiformis TaxID=36881 RepID=A0AAE0BNK2_9CHLO|nr:hypothetical protein CYMTET_50187 [Cymbomonas tetramitiformis]
MQSEEMLLAIPSFGDEPSSPVPMHQSRKNSQASLELSPDIKKELGGGFQLGDYTRIARESSSMMSEVQSVTVRECVQNVASKWFSAAKLKKSAFGQKKHTSALANLQQQASLLPKLMRNYRSVKEQREFNEKLTAQISAMRAARLIHRVKSLKSLSDKDPESRALDQHVTLCAVMFLLCPAFKMQEFNMIDHFCGPLTLRQFKEGDRVLEAGKVISDVMFFFHGSLHSEVCARKGVTAPKAKGTAAPFSKVPECVLLGVEAAVSNKPQEVNLTAHTTCSVVCIPTAKLHGVFVDMFLDAVTEIKAKNLKEHFKGFCNASLLAGREEITIQTITPLARRMSTAHYPKGTEIAMDSTERIMVLLEGSCKVHFDATYELGLEMVSWETYLKAEGTSLAELGILPTTKELEIAVLQRGDVIGLEALFPEARNGYSCRALCDVCVLEIPTEEVWDCGEVIVDALHNYSLTKTTYFMEMAAQKDFKFQVAENQVVLQQTQERWNLRKELVRTQNKLRKNWKVAVVATQLTMDQEKQAQEHEVQEKERQEKREKRESRVRKSKINLKRQKFQQNMSTIPTAKAVAKDMSKLCTKKKGRTVAAEAATAGLRASRQAAARKELKQAETELAAKALEEKMARQTAAKSGTETSVDSGMNRLKSFNEVKSMMQSKDVLWGSRASKWSCPEHDVVANLEETKALLYRLEISMTEIFHMAPEARQRLPNSMVMRRTQREKQEQRRIRKQLIQVRWHLVTLYVIQLINRIKHGIQLELRCQEKLLAEAIGGVDVDRLIPPTVERLTFVLPTNYQLLLMRSLAGKFAKTPSLQYNPLRVLENQLENQRKMGAPMPKMHENVDSRVMEAEQERWISHKLWENSKIALEYGTPGQQLSSFVSNMILVQPPPGSAAHFEGETSACKEDSLLGTPAKASRRAKSLKGCKKTVTVRDGEVATAEDQRLPETPERSPQKCDSSGRDITPQPSPDLKPWASSSPKSSRPKSMLSSRNNSMLPSSPDSELPSRPNSMLSNRIRLRRGFSHDGNAKLENQLASYHSMPLLTGFRASPWKEPHPVPEAFHTNEHIYDQV